MARVTIEDCVKVVPSRFELVVLAAQRTREISSYAQDSVERNNNKEVVTALRDIATAVVSADSLREAVVKKHQSRKFISDVDVIDEADDGFSDEIAESLAEISGNIVSVESEDSDINSEFYSEEAELSEDSISDDESEEE